MIMISNTVGVCRAARSARLAHGRIRNFLFINILSLYIDDNLQKLYMHSNEAGNKYWWESRGTALRQPVIAERPMFTYQAENYLLMSFPTYHFLLLHNSCHLLAI